MLFLKKNKKLYEEKEQENESFKEYYQEWDELIFVVAEASARIRTLSISIEITWKSCFWWE